MEKCSVLLSLQGVTLTDLQEAERTFSRSRAERQAQEQQSEKSGSAEPAEESSERQETRSRWSRSTDEEVILLASLLLASELMKPFGRAEPWEKSRGGSVYFEGRRSDWGVAPHLRTSDGGVQAAEVSCSFALPWELRFSVPGQKIKLCKSQKVEGEGSRWECGLDPPLLCNLG